MDEKESREVRFRVGNVVKWSNGLWIIIEWSENIIDAKYTIRCRMVSFDHENVSAGVTNKQGSKFRVKDVKFVSSCVRSFVMENLEKAVLGVK